MIINTVINTVLGLDNLTWLSGNVVNMLFIHITICDYDFVILTGSFNIDLSDPLLQD